MTYTCIQLSCVEALDTQWFTMIGATIWNQHSAICGRKRHGGQTLVASGDDVGKATFENNNNITNNNNKKKGVNR